MSVLEMARAHLQNVHARVEELHKQKKVLEDEIVRLTTYISRGVEEIEEAQEELQANESVDVSNK